MHLICSVFEILNRRITVLLDRDHQIGHSYFLEATSIDRLHHVLYRRVFPLLQEYFYNDREKLRRLLGAYDPVANKGFVASMGQKVDAFGPFWRANGGVKVPYPSLASPIKSETM